MIVQVNAGDIQSSQALIDSATESVTSALRHVADRVTRVEVHLRDDNASKSASDDKRVTMEARIAGQQPFAVDHASDDLYKSISEAAGKLGRAVKTRLERIAAA
ncbi:HPF/RaiA family ribosome-associated protein [Algisphaera agarilytica]|uniref:Ribosome-associated translation inhibitor RaiA n=1 Tax=Algisphaera agarilytica TaxID=1385975 RepID=A0A7X0LK76_9BACT|nr:HPF/RaiA family ribosome-associated protein [Algisphaera agarilytica]MBB6429346.1 ribosome-associated translation inhibitor RaiA [Algisphaera agarilytica]